MPRPSFHLAWLASQRIYDPNQPSEKVAQIIGGKVDYNIHLPANKGGWSNTCAVRMSYILNYSGIHIPFEYDKTVSGADGKWYFHYVRDVINFLKFHWGKPDIVSKYPPSNHRELSGKKGIILFVISGWTDAGGHATLWNGSRCYDHCYFNEPGAYYHTDYANFWFLS